MKLKKLIMCGVLITGIGITGLSVLGYSSAGRGAVSTAADDNAQLGNHNNPPSGPEVEFARQTSDLLVNELVAALFKEFDETTPNNVEQGKKAISLIFNNGNRDMRLIGAFNPLLGGNNDEPKDDFEDTAMERALQGQIYTSVDRVGGRWYYRRSIPLTNTMHQNCVLCHSNFTPQFFQSTHNPGQWVGALTLRVPIEQE